MVHIFEKPKPIINSALAMLQDSLVLPGLVSLNGLGDFSGRLNDTVTIRIEQPTTANQYELRATGSDRNLVMSTLQETVIDVKLTTNVYHAVELIDEQYTLDIETFAQKILARQVRAVAEKLEFGCGNMIKTAPYVQVHTAVGDAIYDAIVHARRQLNDARVPKQGRRLIVGSAIEEALLLDDRFTRADSAGDGPASMALREARIGRIAGYDVFTVDTIPAGAAYLFHRDAFVMVSRAPKDPLSNVRTASAGVNGLAARWLADYDSSVLQDRSIVNTYVGYEAVIDPEYTDTFGTKGDGFVRAARIQLKAATVDILNTGTVTAGAGANHTRQVRAIDSNGDDRTWEAEWASSDPTKATVENLTATKGLVTGVAAGATNITATVDGNVVDTWALTVSA